jgi:hypothetical protein
LIVEEVTVDGLVSGLLGIGKTTFVEVKQKAGVEVSVTVT